MYHRAKRLKSFLGKFGSTGIDSTDSARNVESDVDVELGVDEDVDSSRAGSARDVEGDTAFDVNVDVARLCLGCEDDVASPL